MFENLFIFVCAMLLLVKAATMATKYSARLAESFHLSKYTIGFIVVAGISILPETLIAINSALAGVPSLGLGTLFGGNVADLTLVFAIIILFAGRGIKIESKVLKNYAVYPLLLLLPLLLGFDGHFSRLEGVALIVAGIVFYYVVLRNGLAVSKVAGDNDKKDRYKNLLLLFLAAALLLLGAYFTVDSAVALASLLGLRPILIGLFIVGLGAVLPELFFSLKAVRKHNDALAVGDILGTVLADATIVVGILALIQPFSFSRNIVFVIGAFMVVAALLLFHFMRSGRVLSKKEGWLLLAFWALFILTEWLVN